MMEGQNTLDLTKFRGTEHRNGLYEGQGAVPNVWNYEPVSGKH